MKSKQARSLRHANEDVAARISRLHEAIDCEPFGGWLAKDGTLDRLALLHRAYADDQQFLRVLSGMTLWAPDEYIGDTSVLSAAEVTIIGSCAVLCRVITYPAYQLSDIGYLGHRRVAASKCHCRTCAIVVPTEGTLTRSPRSYAQLNVI